MHSVLENTPAVPEGLSSRRQLRMAASAQRLEWLSPAIPYIVDNRAGMTACHARCVATVLRSIPVAVVLPVSVRQFAMTE